ncbi:hypothetical protein KFE25_013983 [Diacronema lutheri]|uniref:Zn(2)-C6 fungal-type domain-containing protein n=2 Tax=Diacronema lutheri TaxID=2081491 RepID=A0A8J6C6I3_DIALT|nr:hypothetical protein KFE25_013983 [Diacronema lutheri]
MEQNPFESKGFGPDDDGLLALIPDALDASDDTDSASFPEPLLDAIAANAATRGSNAHEHPVGVSAGGVRKPARASCVACRISKARCDLDSQLAGAMCTRCARLGVQCVPNAPSMRGRKSSTGRLGPAIRALLTPADGGRACGDDTGALASALPPSTSPSGRAPGLGSSSDELAGTCLVTASRAQPRLQQPLRLELCTSVGTSPACAAQLASVLAVWEPTRNALLASGSQSAKLHFLKCQFAAAARYGSYEHTHLTMRQAHELQLPLDATLRALSEMTIAVASASSARAGWQGDGRVLIGAPAHDDFPPVPAFIVEWLASPFMVVVCACAHGAVRWLASGMLQSLFVRAGMADQLAAMLDPQTAVEATRRGCTAATSVVPGAEAGLVAAQHALDNAWLERFAPHERPTLVNLFTSLWATLDFDTLARDGDQPSRRRLEREGHARNSLTPLIGGLQLGPQHLSMRLVAEDMGAVWWEAYHFRPVDAQLGICARAEQAEDSAMAVAFGAAHGTGGGQSGACSAGSGAPATGMGTSAPRAFEGNGMVMDVELEMGLGMSASADEDDAALQALAETIEIEQLLAICQ